MNLDAWKKLSPKQRGYIEKQALALESMNTAWRKLNAEDTKRQAQAGIQVITFDAATSKQFLDKAYDVAWTNLIKVSPVYGPQMRKLFGN